MKFTFAADAAVDPRALRHEVTLPGGEPRLEEQWAVGLNARPWTYPAGAMVGLEAPGELIVRITSGWAFEMRALTPERHQLFSLLLPGDHTLVPAYARPDDIALIGLTPLEILVAPSADGPMAWRAGFLTDVLAQQVARLREHVLRLGLLDGQARIAHLLLELYSRLSALGLVRRDSFRTPLTQDVLASMLGLSVVHVSRSLQRLRQQKLLTMDFGRVSLLDIPTLEKMTSLA